MLPFLLGCAVAHPPVVVLPPVQTVAQQSEIRGWLLKAYWAESQGDIVEAKRCMAWVVRLDGDNPSAKQAATAFARRHELAL